MVDILPAGRPFGAEGACTVRVILGPLHFYDDPIFDVGVHATMGMGIAYGTNGVTDLYIATLPRHLAFGHPIRGVVQMAAHDTVTPFIPHLDILFFLFYGLDMF